MTAPATNRTDDNGPWTVRRILEWTTSHFEQRGIETPRLDAEILLAHTRHCRRIELYTRYDEVLTDAQREQMRSLVRRRSAYEPVAYLVGKREFYGLDFEVSPDVLVPRPDTETLVLHALDDLKGRESPHVLELGTGTGCIAITLAVMCPKIRVTSVDISPAALQVARRNAAAHKVADRITFLEGDLFAPLAPGAKFDALITNPPYVGSEEMPELHPDVRLHEPALALDGGPGGLDIAERIIAGACDYLHSGSLLAIELSPSQMERARQMFESTGNFTAPRILRDAAGKERVISSRRQ